MENVQDLKLIQSNYQPMEAKEILSDILWNKINFFATKNFSSQVRFGQEDNAAVNKITELNATREAIFEIIRQADINNQDLQIEFNITIKLVDKK